MTDLLAQLNAILAGDITAIVPLLDLLEESGDDRFTAVDAAVSALIHSIEKAHSRKDESCFSADESRSQASRLFGNCLRAVFWRELSPSGHATRILNAAFQANAIKIEADAVRKRFGIPAPKPDGTSIDITNFPTTPTG